MDRDQGRALTGAGGHALLADLRALTFWRRLGFVATGDVSWAEPGHVRVAVLEKPLTGDATSE